MADTIELNAGSGGAILSTDQLADLSHVQHVKLMDGTANGTGLVAADAANGLDVDVTRLPATPAGTNLIGSVKISDGTDVALVTAGGGLQVDGSGVTQPVSGTVTADLGATDNAVLDAIAASAAAIDGDTSTIATNTGNAATSLAILDDWDNTASDGASVSGDVAHDGVDAGEPVKIGGYAKAAAPTDVTADADRVNAWFLLNGAQATVVTAAGALIGGDAANGLDVDVTRLPALVAGTANIGDVDVLTVPAPLNVVGTGTEAAALRVTLATDSTGVVSVDDNGGALTVDGAVTVTNATAANLKVEATLAAAQTLATVTTLTGITNALPAGTNAIGKLAANSGVDIGDVDVTSLPAIPAGTNTIGSMLPYDDDLSGITTYMKKYYTSAGAVTDGIVWSPAAGTRWYVKTLYFQVSAAATVTFEDDLTAGDSAVLKGEYAANSGLAINFDPPLFSGEDAADLLVTTSAGNIYVTCVGFES